MTKRMFLAAALGGFPLLKSQSSRAETAPGTEAGAIAAQVAESRTTLQGEAQRIAQDIGARILGRAVNG